MAGGIPHAGRAGGEVEGAGDVAEVPRVVGRPRPDVADPLDLTRASAGERLRLWRVAKDVTQRCAAMTVGLSRSQWQYAEGGRRTQMAIRAARTLQIRLGGPYGPGACRIARWRSRTSVHAVAAALGVSRVTLLRWERADDPRLAAHWRVGGFRFPGD